MSPNEKLALAFGGYTKGSVGLQSGLRRDCYSIGGRGDYFFADELPDYFSSWLLAHQLLHKGYEDGILIDYTYGGGPVSGINVELEFKDKKFFRFHYSNGTLPQAICQALLAAADELGLVKE